MNSEANTRYQIHRTLIQAFCPSLLACLPEVCPVHEEEIEQSGEMERIPLDDGNEFTSRQPQYVVVYGMGNGCWLSDFYREHGRTLKVLHIVEPDAAIFTEQMYRYSWISLLQDGRVRWHIGSSAGNIHDALLNDAPEIASWGIHAWRYIPRTSQNGDWYPSFVSVLNEALNGARGNARIQIERGTIIQTNIVRNLPAILRSLKLDAFADRFKRTPAVVIGAGPSLDKNIDAMREAAPGVLLIASDTALRPLLQHGIQPHFVVSCDPLKLNHRHFEGVASLGNAVLAYLPDTHAGILEQFALHSRRLCLHDLQSKLVQRLAGTMGIRKSFRRRMNVGYCAFILAQEMGCSPIVLAGMDLAVSPGGLSHARGTANASEVTLAGDPRTVRLRGRVETGDMPLIPVEAYFGGETLTFTYFHQILRGLEKSIALSMVPVIDATEGGAKKRGAIQMSLREALRIYTAEEPVANRLNNIYSQAMDIPVQPVLDIFQKIVQGLQAAIFQLRMGLVRLDRWQKELEKTDQAVDIVNRQADAFLQRWTELLSGEALDVGIDIGLARWRYETWRVEAPEGGTAKALGDWWYVRFREWFEGLGKDLELFESLYRTVAKSLQTGLTSIPERQ